MILHTTPLVLVPLLLAALVSTAPLPRLGTHQPAQLLARSLTNALNELLESRKSLHSLQRIHAQRTLQKTPPSPTHTTIMPITPGADASFTSPTAPLTARATGPPQPPTSSLRASLDPNTGAQQTAVLAAAERTILYCTQALAYLSGTLHADTNITPSEAAQHRDLLEWLLPRYILLHFDRPFMCDRLREMKVAAEEKITAIKGTRTEDTTRQGATRTPGIQQHRGQKRVSSSSSPSLSLSDGNTSSHPEVPIRPIKIVKSHVPSTDRPPIRR